MSSELWATEFCWRGNFGKQIFEVRFKFSERFHQKILLLIDGVYRLAIAKKVSPINPHIHWLFWENL
jgi:hypothetical protein